MSTPTVAVTCNASDQGGADVSFGEYTAKLDQTEIYDGFVVPEIVTVIANIDGVAILNLWPNALGVNGSSYRITARNPDTGRKFFDASVVVPNNPCNLFQIIQSAPFPSVDSAQQALIDVQALVAIANQDVLATDDDRVAAEIAAAQALTRSAAAALSQFEAAASELRVDAALLTSPAAVALGANLATADGVLLVGNAADKRDLASGGGAGLVGNTPAGNIASTTVQAALNELDVEKAQLTALAAPAGAALVGNTPVGSIAATTVQGAINEIVSDLAASSGASLVGYMPSGAGAVATTVQVKQRERKSLLDFMSDALKTVTIAGAAYTVQNRADMFTAVTAAWNSALLNGHDLYAPAGRFELGDNNFPWRQQTVTALLDCKNVTLYCDGPATVFATVSSAGADVFQLNGLKNFHVKGFPTITASLTGTAGAGSNGCSVTNGYDNLTLEISPTDCQSIDKTTYVDGGKGLTIQCDGATLEVGKLKATVRAKQCFQGFGFEANLFSFLNKKVSIDIDIIAEDCYSACSISAPAATGAIPAGTHAGVRVKGQAINCQKDVELFRVHGVLVDIQTVTTKIESARRLDARGIGWYAANIVVESLLCSYAKNSQIRVTGNKGACAYKAQIGGATAGSSGLTGQTEHCDIYLDIGGTASVANLNDVDSGGNTVANSRIEVTPTTASVYPLAFATEATNNTLIIGQSSRFVNPVAAGRLSMAFAANGTTETGKLDLTANVTGLHGKATSTAGAVVAGLYDSAGTFRLGILNGNGIVVDGLGTSAALGAYVGKQPVYNSAGTLIGWFPLYA